MFRKTHEAEIAEYAADLKRANEARDNWRDSSKEWEAKFKKAVADLVDKSLALCDVQAELRATEALLINAENERDALRPDATLWRNARDKRAKNRGGGK